MQSNAAKAVVALLAVAALVVLFFVLSEDETSTDQAPDGPPAAETGPEPGAEEEDSPLEAGPETERTGPPTIRVVDGGPRGGVAEYGFSAGDRIRFIVRSDTADEIHVHGYDVYADVAAGEPAELDFRADLEGVYEVELHGSGTQIAQLTIRP